MLPDGAATRIKELKASLETIRATASELITEIDGHFRELQQQREAAQEERPVLESLDLEQQQAIRDEVQATLQMLVNADMQISGEVSQGTLDALTAQGYVLQDGVVQRMQQAELPIPDPTITVQEMNEYGYKWDGMLPLQEEAARRLFENEGVEIYRIYEDNTEGAVLNADEITEHAAQGGIFGVEKEAWQRHLEKPQQEQEAAEQTAPQPESTFAIYQLKDGEETRDYRFEPLDRLRAVGLDVQRDNYELVYSAPLADGESLEDIYRRFNIDHPADFTGHSLSISDIVVLRNGDTETAHLQSCMYNPFLHYTRTDIPLWCNILQPGNRKMAYTRTSCHILLSKNRHS